MRGIAHPAGTSEGGARVTRRYAPVAVRATSPFLPAPSRAELRRRLPRLVVGLVVMGMGLAFMIRANLGLGPWDVLHQGIAERIGLPIGTVVILVGLVVLVGWIPLRERMGVGTIANAVVIGVVIDLTMLAVPDLEGLAVRGVALVGGILAMGVGTGIYIGAGLGPGPRDGLMTGIARRGPSIRVVRTGIELAALAGGWLLGGTVGAGTVLMAFGIGPVVQASLHRFSLPPLAPTPVPHVPDTTVT